MARRFISTKTTYLDKPANGTGKRMTLIYGDEVDTDGIPDSDSTALIGATFRGRHGRVRQDRLMEKKPLEIYFVDVGQGDSTFVITPGGRKILIDGGENMRAVGFLIWLYRLDQPGSSVDLDLVVLTHADGDHLEGLTPVINHPKINVSRVVHNGLATFASGHDLRVGNLDASGDFVTTWHDALSELPTGQLTTAFAKWRQAILDEGCEYGVVDSTTGVLDVGDSEVELDIIGPHYEERPDGSFALPYFDSGGEHAHTINGHSVVGRLTYGDVRMMLSGDLNTDGSEYLLGIPEIASRLSAHIFKTPHHGSHDFSTELFEAIRPQISAVSSGDAPDHGHPRASFLAAVGRASRSPEPLLFSTEIAATFIEAKADELDPDEIDSMEDLDFSVSAHNITARKLFKQRLPGIINVRTDGKDLYAARRVNAGYWWESYGPMAAAPHPAVF